MLHDAALWPAVLVESKTAQPGVRLRRLRQTVGQRHEATRAPGGAHSVDAVHYDRRRPESDLLLQLTQFEADSGYHALAETALNDRAA
jgi:hypothetical protein